MISEPELVGDEPFERPGDRPGAVGPGIPRGPGPGETLAGGQPPQSGGRPRRAWWWAFGGALAASVLWTAGLAAHRTLALDPGGYRATEDLCELTEAGGIRSALGTFGGRGAPLSSLHPARDEASCFRTVRLRGAARSGNGQGEELATPTVYVSYILHKAVDPEPEFEAVIRAREVMWDGSTEVGSPRARAVDGVGERAFVTAGPSQITLDVLDGQAEFHLTVAGDIDRSSGEPVVDLFQLEGPMIEDMRALMARLKG
ncbi:hypothetical protein [Streptomyces sp. C10-9-1]|uniref:hypothetical protein n=1 Tax=Streptomyces sp. C10-9-1 TaxID=1859285 RepID=UPI003D75533B